MGWASVLLVSRVLSSHRARLQTSRKVTICRPGLALPMVLLQANLRVPSRELVIPGVRDGVVTGKRHPE